MRTAFVDHCLELLATLGPVHARRMFGGHGVYAQDVFVALIVGHRLYVKVDGETEARFVSSGSRACVRRPQVQGHARRRPSLEHPGAARRQGQAFACAEPVVGGAVVVARGCEPHAARRHIEPAHHRRRPDGPHLTRCERPFPRRCRPRRLMTVAHEWLDDGELPFEVLTELFLQRRRRSNQIGAAD
jgi:hypothetical protein